MADGIKGMTFGDFASRIPHVSHFDLKGEDLSVFPPKVAKELEQLSQTDQRISYSEDNLRRVWDALVQTARDDRDVPKAGSATLQPPRAGRAGIQLHGNDRLSGPQVEMLISMFVRTD